MYRRRRCGVPALLLCLAAAACSADEGDPARPGSPPAVEAGRGDTVAPPESSAPPDPAVRPVVVGHATAPRLRLTARQLDRLAAGRVHRWRGRRVVDGLRSAAAARRAVRAVERDPGTVAVVPPDAVGPTVTAATVDGADPVRSHPDAFTVTVVGDVMLVRGVPDPEAALAPMRPLLRRADLAVGNLESTLSTEGSPTQGGDSFGGDPALAGVLRRAGFDAVSLANNHAGDYGERALLATVGVLRRRGPVPFGAGADVRAAARPAVFRTGDGPSDRIVFLGFNAIGETPMATQDSPGALSVRMPPRTGPLVPADLERVLRKVRRADRRGDAVVVLPHWGEQYTHTPWPVQRQVARQLVDAGADLVVGGHPHWVQGVDAVDRRPTAESEEGASPRDAAVDLVPVLHSLGNFVFDMDFAEQTMEGVVLETTWWGTELKAIRLVPYAMDPVTFAPRVVRGERAAGILGDVWGASTGPFAG